VPGASRGGQARISFAKRASPSLERSGPRSASCRSWLAGPRCGNASKGQRNRHRLVPASSGARAPLACEGRRLVGCARASYQGCRSRQASPRLIEARTRWQWDTWTGAGPAGPKGQVGQRRRQPGRAVAKPRGQAKAGAGRSKGRRGAKVPVVRKAHRAAPPTRTASRGRAGSGLGDSHSGEGRDRGVRSASAHIARGRQRPPRRTRNRLSAVRRSESLWREPGDSPARHGRKPVTEPRSPRGAGARTKT
jgi:hypothetical protein